MSDLEEKLQSGKFVRMEVKSTKKLNFKEREMLSKQSFRWYPDERVYKNIGAYDTSKPEDVKVVRYLYNKFKNHGLEVELVYALDFEKLREQLRKQ